MSDLEKLDDSVWATDTPISLPVPPNKPVLVKMGALGFTEYGMAHDITVTMIEEYTPTFVPRA